MALTRIPATGIKDDAVTSAKIKDAEIVNADVAPNAGIADTKLATITTSGKVNVSALSGPGSTSVFAAGDGSWGTIDTSQQDANAQNIGLLGFKMAVNDGLTVFNLVDGVVDEFHDESGTDESEGSNDTYNSAEDLYVNSTGPQGTTMAYSAGFGIDSITEPETSVAGDNPTPGTAEFGTYTVPTNLTSAVIKVWGAGGGGAPSSTNLGGAGGGFSTGTLAVTPGQTLYVSAGEGGIQGGVAQYPAGIGRGGRGVSTPSGGTGGGGGAGGVTSAASYPQVSAPTVYIMAGGGGTGAAMHTGGPDNSGYSYGGPGGGLTGDAGLSSGLNPGPATSFSEQTSKSRGTGTDPAAMNCGGGGDQEQGGEGGTVAEYTGPAGGGNGQSGAAFQGGDAVCGGESQPGILAGAGGGGYFGGGGAAFGDNLPNNTQEAGGGGGGGSSYFGHPQITSGSTEEGDRAPDSVPGTDANKDSGGDQDPAYSGLPQLGPLCQYRVGEGPSGGPGPGIKGQPGYVLITGSVAATTLTTNIYSNAFTAGSVPTAARIVVFEENVATPTLNTDIIASISRDGTNYTNATLSDSGYVTGASGQRILTGQATISGQPSGQSMRWKLALANNAIKIHGVALQWS